MNIDETLQDVLNEASPNTIIYIGAAGGFFFIGTKEEYEEDISYIEDDYKRNTSNRLVRAEHKYYLAKEEHPDLDPSVFDNLRIEYKAISDYQKKQTFPFSNRKVLSVYKKKLKGEKGYAIQIEGEESGHCWLKHEYRRPYKVRRRYE